MAISKAQQRAVAKYTRANYDEITVRVPKGDKEIIKAHAESMGESVNAFIGRAILEAMARDKGGKSPASGKIKVDTHKKRVSTFSYLLK